MKKKLLTSLICLCTAISIFAYSGGNGTEANPYLISNKADMEQLATNVNGGQTYAGVYFRLTRNLTETADTVSTIVGNSNTNYFSGTFDGDGYEIAVNKTGIFGLIQNATIKNLGVAGKIINYSYYYYSSSSYYYYYYYSGAVCGYALSSTISNCRNNAKIETVFSSSSSYYSYYNSGGICGYASGNTLINNCYNINSVSASINIKSVSRIPEAYSGGICGFANANVAINNCYNTGDVKASAMRDNVEQTTSFAGGISGYGGKIQNCFVSSCNITNAADIKRERIGRIGGTNGTYTNCYADDVSTRINNDPIGSSNANSKDGKDETTANLQSKAWLSSNLNWDFTVWKIKPNQFPVFITAPSIKLVLSEITYGYQAPLIATTDNDAVPIVYTSSDNTIAEITGGLLIAKKAGTVTITASQEASDDFFAGNTAVNLTIQKKELTVTANSANIIYGDVLPSSYSLEYSGFIGSDTETILTKLPIATTTATTNSNVGEYPITPSGAVAENYSFVYNPGVLTIQKRDLQVKANDATRLYGYSNPAFTLSYSGFVNGNTEADIAVKPTAVTLATISSNAGEYPLTCTGGNAVNYNFVFSPGTLTITKAPLTVSVTNASRNYGAQNPVFSVTYSGFRNSDNQNSLTVQPKAVCAAVQNSNVGSYPITFTNGESTNYEFSYVPGTMVINKVPLTITSQSVSMLYGDALPEFSALYSGFVNNEAEESLTKRPVFNTIATKQSNAGTYTITPSGAEAANYTISYQQGTLTIQKRNLIVKPDNFSRVYGYANPSLTLSYDGFVNGNTADNISVKPTASTTAAMGSSVGEYAITCSGGNATNYNFIYGTGILTITKAPLTVSVSNASRMYGDDNPAFLINYSGFRNADSRSSLIAEPLALSSAARTSNVGTYPITVSGGNATNYSFVYNSGTLTVNKAPLTVSANSESREYGENNPSFTVIYSGFKNADSRTSLISEPQVNATANRTSSVGTYLITVSGGNATNYSFVYNSGTLIVSKAQLTVSANNASREYGENNPNFTLNYIGFKNADSKTSLILEPRANTTATRTSNVGTYPITVSDGSATNYSFVYNSGILTITKAPLTITADNKERYTGEANPEFTLSYAGFKNNETAAILTQLPNVTCAADEKSPEGFYDIVLSGGSSTNYSFVLVNGKLKVTTASGVKLISPDAVSFYPNPVRSDLFIRADFPIDRVEVYSLSGNLIKTTDEFTQKINMSGLTAGVYFVKIYAEQGVLIKKVVKD